MTKTNTFIKITEKPITLLNETLNDLVLTTGVCTYSSKLLAPKILNILYK